jgi:hypothetical protein
MLVTIKAGYCQGALPSYVFSISLSLSRKVLHIENICYQSWCCKINADQARFNWRLSSGLLVLIIHTAKAQASCAFPTPLHLEVQVELTDHKPIDIFSSRFHLEAHIQAPVAQECDNTMHA